MSATSSTRSILGRVNVSYPRLQRLLVPLDFSGKSRQALRYAVPLAPKFSARIHLVHVLPADENKGRDENHSRAHGRAEAAWADGRAVPSCRACAPNTRCSNSGKPAEAILTLVAEHSIDLIVLTTKGESALKRAGMGRDGRNASCARPPVR